MTCSDDVRQEPFVYSRFGNDPDYDELVELFVAELPARVRALHDSAHRHDWKELGRLAHQLKGASGSYGFDPYMPLAARLETACRENRPDDEIRQALNRLVEICQRTRSGVMP